MALNYANNQSLSNITSLPASITGGALTLLETQTASSSATISFTSNIDSTYDAYMFKFYDIHPETNQKSFQFQSSTNGGSSYGVTTTTTYFQADHPENDSSATLTYVAGSDLAQSTSFQTLSHPTGVSNDNDACFVGSLKLFAPSNTTFVKHFICTGNTMYPSWTVNTFVAGYFNTTSAIDAVQFKFDSGNIDSGTIKLYGVS